MAITPQSASSSKANKNAFEDVGVDKTINNNLATAKTNGEKFRESSDAWVADFTGNKKPTADNKLSGNSNVALATPSFSSAEQHKDTVDNTPLKELEVVDIYKQQAGVVVTSYTEISEQANSLMDKVKGIFDNSTFKDTLKTVTTLANKAKSAVSVFNALKSGNIGSVVAGIGAGSRLIGLDGVAPLAQKAMGVAYALNSSTDPTRVALNAASAVGFNTSSANRLLTNVSSLSGVATRLRNATGVTGSLNALTSATGSLTSLSNSMDAFSKYNFDKDLQKVSNVYVGNADKAQTSLGSVLKSIGSSVDKARVTVTTASNSLLDSLLSSDMGEDGNLKPSLLEKDPKGSAGLIYAMSSTSSSLGLKGNLVDFYEKIGKSTPAGKALVSTAVEQFNDTSDINQLTQIQQIAGASLKASQAMQTILSKGSVHGLKEDDYLPTISKAIDLASASDADWGKEVIGNVKAIKVNNIGNNHTSDMLQSYSASKMDTSNLFTDAMINKPKLSETGYMAATAVAVDSISDVIAKMNETFLSTIG